MEQLILNLIISVIGMAIISQLFEKHMGTIVIGVLLFGFMSYFNPFSEYAVTFDRPTQPQTFLPQEEKDKLPPAPPPTNTSSDNKKVNVSPKKGAAEKEEPQIHITINLNGQPLDGNIEVPEFKYNSSPKGTNVEELPREKPMAYSMIDGYIILCGAFGLEGNAVILVDKLRANGFSRAFYFYLSDYTDDDRRLYAVSLAEIFESEETAERAMPGYIQTAREKKIPVKSGRVMRIQEAEKRSSYLNSR